MNKNLFEILPADFFKPLTSKYRRMYADIILIIFNSYKTEITYGVDREVVVRILTDYFEADDDEITFDDETYISDAREKANGAIAQLKSAGWIEYEQGRNHDINVVMYEYAIPVIDSMNKIIRDEETEYQGLISQIYSTIRNDELLIKPYELIIVGVEENTERLISELKRLSVSIKRYMDKLTNNLSANEILEHFLEYHNEIGSKSYKRMKTAENISYFRNTIIERLDEMLSNAEIMERATLGYAEVNNIEIKEVAYDKLVSDMMDIKSAFYRLDDIIEEIDNKHTRYMRNAIRRAEFLLSTGSNIEGKLSKILNAMSEEINIHEQKLTEIDESGESMSVFTQRYISSESLKTIPLKKRMLDINAIDMAPVMRDEERALYKEALRQKNRRRFTRKNINEYVTNLLKDREKIPVNQIEIDTKRDVIRLIYISIYSGNPANNYKILRSSERINIKGYNIPYFEIIRRD